jgi:hypothetical protein
MTYNLQIVRTNDFVRYDGDGKHDVEQSRLALRQIAQECVEKDVDCALIDLRGAESKLPFTDVYKLAVTFSDAGFQYKHKVAVLHRYRGGERAEIFAMFAAAQGWQVRAFETYEDVMEWFSATEQV